MAEGTVAVSTFYNRTRRTASIPRRLVREGKLHLLPVYYLGLTTALGKEAIENSGSYDFADHIYGNRPAGKFVIGYLLDALFLNLKSARSFRSRYLNARSEIQRLIVERADPIDVLAVPCGLARELFDVSVWLAEERPTRQVRLCGMDLDQRCETVVGSRRRELCEEPPIRERRSSPTSMSPLWPTTSSRSRSWPATARTPGGSRGRCS